MNEGSRLFLVVMIATCLLGSIAGAQDSPSLGDVARRQREQKEQAETAPGEAPARPKVITNEEIPEHTEDQPGISKDRGSAIRSPASKTSKQGADAWRSRILAEKGQIANLQRRIDQINGSIRFSSVACASCVVRNERQLAKEQQVVQMQSDLDQHKKRLEEMQDAARKQGYGSSVYDP